LVGEKSNDPRWALPGYTIEMDPHSRYYDPCDPDRPPMPPDDPASHRLMHCVDCKKGWPHWHDNGDRVGLENPVWREALGQYAELDEEGQAVLSVNAALRLAYLHSPDYQNQLETVYLSALDVSTERFRFDTQFFGSLDTNYVHNGYLVPSRLRYDPAEGRFVLDPAVRGAEQNRLTVGRPTAQPAVTRPTLGLTKNFATAGELLVGFANSFVWEFTSGNANLASSIANFSLVQPLLRGAGRDVAMEQLTIVERVLLANLRAFERYRQGFYTRVAIGELGVTGPQRRGGFLGGTGLTGFSGTGSGGLGGVGEATGFGRTGFGAAAGGTGGGTGFAGGGAGQVGGFLGLLQQLQQIRNTEDSLNLQLRTLALLEEYLNAGVIDLVQVDQFRQSIETERANLLQARNSLLLAQDNYVTGTLGLPPDLPIDLDDQLIRQFQLVDPQATALQNQIVKFQEELGELPDEPDLNTLRDLMARIVPLRGQFEERFASTEQDLARMKDKAEVGGEATTDQERRLSQQERRLLADSLTELRQRFQETSPQLEQLQNGLAPDTRRQTAEGLVVWLGKLYRLVGEAILVQARARLESIAVERIELGTEDAFQMALSHRLDIMNRRAALVDTWRLIAFNADALQSRLDVIFEGDLSTARNNPVSFRAPTGNLRVGLQFDAPFTRLLERNNYRQSLIDYQRDRRSFIQSLDSVHRDLRQLLRRLEELRINLEIQRRAVAISIRRVDLTQEELNKPVPPPQPGQPAAQFGPTAALNLLTALSDLRNTQNNFMSVWLNHYATRMQLMRELGVMVLDEQGRWVDVPLDKLTCAPPEEIPLPPAVPLEWMEQAFQDEGPVFEAPDNQPPIPAEPPPNGELNELLPPPNGTPAAGDELPGPVAAEEPRTAVQAVGIRVLRFLGRP
jgi:outer membrane protein TolC